MATIKYKCDRCKREVELIENKTGLTTFGSCIITDKCAGRLYSLTRKPNNLREGASSYNPELNDYQPRKLLYVHTQKHKSTVWKIEHNLGRSCVFVVYSDNSVIMDPDSYTVTAFDTYSTITFPFAESGIVHVITRTDGQGSIVNPTSIGSITVVSGNGILTFAIPKYITRINSGAASPTTELVTPTPTQTPVPNQPYSVCNNVIQIEIEIQRPNEQAITCTEVLGEVVPPNAWAGWNEIMVKNRKLYCVKSKVINTLKIFTNVNSGSTSIPDGTVFKILRIDYGTGVLTNIPDRGLLMLMSATPHSIADKDLHNVVDCGELVGVEGTSFIFKNNELYVNTDHIEKVYPKITKL